MAGRPVQNKANIEAIKKLRNGIRAKDGTLEELFNEQLLRPVIVYTMRECGCTFAEIGKVFDISRQMAEQIYNKEVKAL